MLFMELAVGQYTGRGPIGAIGQLCPLFKGLKNKIIHSFILIMNLLVNSGSNNLVLYSKLTFFLLLLLHFAVAKGAGMASVVVSFIMSTYYSVIIAYAIYYFFSAFRPETPWLDCKQRLTHTQHNHLKIYQSTLIK